MCLEEAPFYAATSMPTMQSAAPYRHRKRSRGLFACLTRMRVNAQEEKRKHGIAYDTSSPLEKGRAEGAGWMCLEEAPLLRRDQYANCAKRYSISSFRAKREIFVIRGLAVNDWKFQTGNLLST